MHKSDAGVKRFTRADLVSMLFLGLVGTVAAAMVLSGTSRYGAGISPDSLAYLSAARNVFLGKGFMVYNNEPYLSWPPLFPAILAALTSAGMDASVGARLINTAAFGLIVVLSGALLLNAIHSKLLACLALLSILFSFPLLSVSVMVWTEAVYTLFSIIFFLVLLSYLRSGSPPQLIICALLAALACLQRYVGITLVITGAAAVLLFSHVRSWRKRIIHLLCFCLIALIPVLLWLLRNYLLAGTIGGHRYPAYYGLLKNISLSSGTLGAWILPLSFPPLLRHCIVIALTTYAILTHLTPFRPGAPHDQTIRQKWLSLMVLYCAFYTVFIIGISSLKAFEPIGDRFLAPLYPLVMLILVTAVDDRCRRLHLSAAGKQWTAGIIAVLLSVWLIHPVSQTLGALSEWRKSGAGEDFFGRSYYGKRAWQESPLAAWLRSHPPGETVISNEPLALYALTGIVSRMSPLTYESPERFRNEAPTAQAFLLVWFHDQCGGERRFFGKEGQFLPLSGLREFFFLEKVQTFADGDLYHCIFKRDTVS